MILVFQLFVHFGFISISLTAHFIIFFFLSFYLFISLKLFRVNQLLSTSDIPNKKNFIDDNDVSIYKTKRTISTSLFTASTRPQHIQRLYEQAVPAPVVPICNGETSSEDSFSVCPLSFGHTRRQITRKIDAEIETRVVRIDFICVFFYYFICVVVKCLCRARPKCSFN